LSTKAPFVSDPSALQSALRPHLLNALLPGEPQLDEETLAEAADFLVETAAQREPGNSALRLESSTTGRRRLRLAIINDDMPFLVDSVCATIAAAGLSIDRLIHPVVPVRRNAAGALDAIAPMGGGDDHSPESMIYIETPRVDARQRRELVGQLEVTLGDVRAAVADWPQLQAAMARDAAILKESGAHENAALMEWLNAGMLTQLGHVTRTRAGEYRAALGVCRESLAEVLAPASFDRAFEWFEQPGPEGAPRSLLIIKANHLSNVHRRAALDLFIVPHHEDGAIVALSIHAGLWTSAALASAPADVPILRARVEKLARQFGFSAKGHAGKALIHAFTTLPHDLLVAFSEDDVCTLATALMSLVDRPRTRLVLVGSPLQRHVYAFVWLARDMLSTGVRLSVRDLLLEIEGSALLDWSIEVEGSSLALMQFLIDTRASPQIPDAKLFEQRLEDLLRGWGEAVERALAQGEESSRAAAIAQRYADAFPQVYRSQYGPAEAAIDITRLRTLAAEHGRSDHACDARLYRMEGDEPRALRLKIYHHAGQMPLSDTVPGLENFGFRVIGEMTTRLADGALGTVHDFRLEVPALADLDDLLARAGAIETAIAEVINAHAEDDAFNRLVIDTRLTSQETEWLRAIYRYLRQTGLAYTIYTVVDALARAPQVTAAMIALFRARHDPAFEGDRSAAAIRAEALYNEGLAQVSAINDDRLLRQYRAVIDACLRTNAFAPAGKLALAFKIESAKMPGLPSPVPWREVFVYSARVEGIHLRSGPVARGGLRWSDRRDDFRTEILGLMKAQRVKNAVIVPSGAKGGFYPKQLPDPGTDRDGWAAEGQASYEIFIATLLSITDNIVDGRVIHPEGVRILDGEDPYFVVAADKGTARFSDIANGIAIERDFWLGDAFASGGSNGYDHKAMGITAKGAWVSVQRHFREMGIDVQNESVRVAGCGDMSGDVFGNGMLLSKAIKLVAAFDHRHIFLDPDPDPAASWAERKRMFDLPRSSWEDYDAALLSKGGGIYARSLKRITVSEEARAMLGLAACEIEPDALISAILKAEVDLLWFGGIGTYIKAAHESHGDVGDPANDSLRVNASEVRARVIGEGANLGVTQAGRIAFALYGAGGEGGRINTDFIDNSAGVDCSDNEVNIKIALAAARRAGDLDEEARNALLEGMTDEVAAIVLEDNRLQALALSIAETAGAAATPSFVRLIERLEETGDLDRVTEGLAPSDALLRRAGEGAGLTRPELAVLLSSAKLVLQGAIEASALPDDPLLEEDLAQMFPSAMREAFRPQIEQHRLRRELIATDLANRIVNRLGLFHAFELAEEEGMTLAEVASAFVVTERLFDIPALWEALDTQAMHEEARLALFDRLSAAQGNLMSDALRTGAGQVAASQLIDALSPGIRRLIAERGDLISHETRTRTTQLSESFVALGAPLDLAQQVAWLFDLDGSIGLADLARDTGLAPERVTQAFTDIGTRIGLDWAQGTAAHMSPSDIWERLLVSGLARDFQQMRLEFLRRQVRAAESDAVLPSDPVDAVARWAEQHSAAIEQFGRMIARAQSHQSIAPAMLAQIAGQARNLLER
jgi:glutamate dehydrogenase